VNVLGRRIRIRGVVQGVGFRPWVYRLATEEGIVGRVRNDAGGVTIDAFGNARALDDFVRRLAATPPPAAELREVRAHPIPGERLDTFSILGSDRQSDRRISIPPDLATCAECLRDILDASNRRHGYAFTNCTNCGPRFTIARDAPYDRATTTMAAFTMCAQCQHEYDSPADRRFHAEPNACPACGPTLTLITCERTVLSLADPLAAVATALRLGNVVAIKGIGGFHLACDATSADAVERLRVRKRRDAKPFAVMVADLQTANELAVLTDVERALLISPERPIVLASAAVDSRLARNVAPHSSLVGMMLPYTPLHACLMREVARPLVMTSANLSDEPLAYRNDEALERLGSIADLFLTHNREIEAPCDDSVSRVIEGRPVVLRRARGYVPRPIAVARPFALPVLACGALTNSTFCIGHHDEAYLGPHIGDLDNVATHQAFEAAIARMERFLRVTPAIVAHDLHPDYRSTTYALTRTACERVAVQHHHAHVASAMAEHALPGPVLGIAFDGTGHGTDGTAWGGEILVARYERFDRVATLRGVPLAGGDAAIRHPWRIALALLEDAFDGRPPLDALRLFHAIRAQDLLIVRQMLSANFRSPIAHGAGRYFDGIGALVLERPDSRYEGQVATEWGGVADPDECGCYGYEIDYTQPLWNVDLRPMVRDVVGDLIEETPGRVISGRFHNTLVQATSEVVRAANREHGRLPVVLTGGCFQNPRLAEHLAGALAPHSPVYLHSRVPPGDGGLALGQALVAAAVIRSRGAS
jgi:hydrogenase maturation protein HypF